MIKGKRIYIDDGSKSPAFRIVAPKNEPLDTRFYDCACAHNAWFHRNKESASGQAIIACSVRGLFHRNDVVPGLGGLVAVPDGRR